MMKSWLSVILCGFFFYGNSQQALLDSAYQLINSKSYLSAVDLFDSASHISIRNAAWEQALEALERKAYCLVYAAKYDELSKITDAAVFKTLNNNFHKDHLLWAKLYTNIGVGHSRLKKFPTSLFFYNRALSIYKKIGYIHPIVPYTYKNAAKICIRLLEYDKASNYSNEVLLTDTSGHYHATAFANLVMVSAYQDDFEKAANYFEKGIQFKSSSDTKTTLSLHGAMAYIGLKNYGKGLQLLNGLEQNKVENPQLLFLYAKAYEGLNQIPKANLYFKKAADLAVSVSPNTRTAAKFLSELANFQLTQKQTDQALYNYHQALTHLFPKLDGDAVFQNPDVKEVYRESWIMTAAAGKGKAAFAKYEATNDEKYLQLAADSYAVSIAAARLIQQHYSGEASKMYLSDFNYKKYEAAIAVQAKLYKLHHKGEQLENIFELMEQSKATVLLEAVQKNKPDILKELPDSLVASLQLLHGHIAELEVDSRLEPANQNLQTELDRARQDLNFLELKIAEDFPALKKRQMDIEIPTIQKIQQELLQDNQMLIEYFYGDNKLYAIGATKTNVQLIAIDEVSSLYQNLLAFIGKFENRAVIENDPKAYLTTANELYNVLCKPLLSTANDTINSVIIVPDGLLNFLPFDALITQPSENLRETAYLLYQQTIMLAFSATAMMQQPKNEIGKGNYLLAMAPVFDTENHTLTPLQYSVLETDWIGRYAGTKTAVRNEATMQFFQASAPLANLIHLSTHAGLFGDDKLPHIQFYDSTCYLPTLYATRIPANLVVLSACNTSLGKIERGEGVMSLARGFAYAGAASLVSSIWSVNEASTAQLFRHFYKRLENGETKSTALHNAKLDYLADPRTSNIQKSPYYWAGFVFIGQDSTFPLHVASSKWWWIGGLLSIGLLLLIVKLFRPK